MSEQISKYGFSSDQIKKYKQLGKDIDKCFEDEITKAKEKQVIRYRLLSNGDIIGEGCESLQDDAVTWIMTEPVFWTCRFTSELFRPMRMPEA
jgi:hypothetical protein